MRWAGHVAPMKETWSAYKGLDGKPEGRRPSGRPRHSLVDNIKMDVTICSVKTWTGFILHRIGPVVDSCEHSIGPSGSVKCWDFFEWDWASVGFSGRAHGVS
jgi:hypothetical protein